MNDQIYVTKYLPIAWLDEVTPDSQNDVSTFLFQTSTGQWAIKPAEDDEEEAESYIQPVFDGQIILFSANRDYGAHVMTVDQNGKAWTPTVPEDANGFILDNENETYAESAQELADNGIDGVNTPTAPGNYDIRAWFWDDAETRFRVVIEGETARFEPCAGAN